MTGKRNVRPRYAPLKIGTEVRLVKEEKVKVRDLEPLVSGGGVAEYIRFRAGTTGRITVPKLINGNVVVDIFLVDKGTKGYEITRSNVRALPKQKKPLGNCVPKGLDLLSPAERATLSPMAVKHLAASLTNQRRAKKAMLEAIQTYADCTANVSHARRLAHQQSKAKGVE
jgi:hypothetical protein